MGVKILITIWVEMSLTVPGVLNVGAVVTADHGGVDNEVGSVLRHTTQQLRHALPHVGLRVVEAGEQLGDDT